MHSHTRHCVSCMPCVSHWFLPFSSSTASSSRNPAFWRTLTTSFANKWRPPFMELTSPSTRTMMLSIFSSRYEIATNWLENSLLAVERTSHLFNVTYLGMSPFRAPVDPFLVWNKSFFSDIVGPDMGIGREKIERSGSTWISDGGPVDVGTLCFREMSWKTLSTTQIYTVKMSWRINRSFRDCPGRWWWLCNFMPRRWRKSLGLHKFVLASTSCQRCAGTAIEIAWEIPTRAYLVGDEKSEACMKLFQLRFMSSVRGIILRSRGKCVALVWIDPAGSFYWS